jgi:pimeloyl-ACP methyl ester carboxylesterase
VQLAVLIERSFKAALATGVALTIQCSEAMDFDHAAALERGSRTLFGNYRLEQQLQGCAVWPHEEVPPLGVEDPEPQDAPALWLSGAFDPVTPPAYGDDAATLFPNSLHLVLGEGQHGPFDLDNSWECVHQIWGEFLERGAVEGLDTTCTEAMHRPPFIADGEAFRAYVAEVLAPAAQ